MPETTLDLRDVPPPERHPKIHHAFEALDNGETLRLINDHEPRPLFPEAEGVSPFDGESYAVEQRDDDEFVADLPKL